ncbi:MAG: glycosyltransferase family 39 protein [Chthoniobacter sp.]|nr:glycosyltransferase family 39 protein [Chthoniobacter sp.]
MTSAVSSFKPIQRIHCVLIFLVMLVLRVASAWRFRADTDELQHLHVVWGWVNGYLPYRDVFDNHGPIFHVLLAPLFYLLGERADILVPMRLAMIPFFAICLWCIYRIGTALFSRNVAIWSTIFAGFYPEFFLTSAEFRTDVLWTTLWFLTLVTITRPAYTMKHAFLTGLLLGGCFGVTVKTGLMVGALGPWGLLGAVRVWKEEGKAAVRSLAGRILAGLAGFVIVPGGAFLFFVMHGAGPQFLYCNISHNLVPHAQNWARFDEHVLWFPIFLIIVVGAFVYFRKLAFSAIAIQRIGLVLTAGFYFTALKTFFPTLTRQDDLPVIPLATLVVIALPFLLADRLASRPRLQMALQVTFPVLLLIEIVVIAAKTANWRDDTAAQFATVADVLKATEKREFVMDATGETIYRPRPYYYAIEAFTKVRIERGLIEDNIAQRLIDTQTALVRPRDLTAKARLFIRENYLLIGHDLWMLGKKVKPSKAISKTEMNFETAIGGSYTILTPEAKMAMGTLDGIPFTGERLLEPGKHHFVAEAAVEDYLLLFSARGFQRGFIPHEAESL